jgi:NAD(P) transhydrogenase subunit beta
MIDNWRDAIVDISYFAAAICFIVGLKFLSTPTRARRGNQIAAIGMAIAIAATFISRDLRVVSHNTVTKDSTTNIVLIVLGIIIGGVISSVASRRVKMTAMPQMVAIFNGMGGATAALVELSTFMIHDSVDRGEILSIVLGAMIGSISFTGSMIAFAKLQELMSGRPITFPNQKLFNAIIFAAIVVLGILVIAIGGGETSAKALLWLLFVAALVLGVLVVLPIGGADMPVVIAILNSLTGLAAALTGLVLSNQALVIAGALVGASGSYLTLLMGRAMNRSVANVLFGAFGGGPAPGAAGAAATGEALPVRETTPEDAAVALAYAEHVIIVPGYGLAVAQAQHAVRELADVLEERGVDVKYAIHPVAGRMPGHMNVLLAEANVPYDDLYEMEQINDDFANTDVAVVIGANDVTNPAARNDPSSPIYGMPILNVDQAKSIIVLKRSMKSGFAGIENMLFHDPKTTMLFGDAKDSVTKLITAVKAA